MVVLRENEWAERMIESKSLGKKPFETLRRVARYYLDKGFDPKDVRRKLDIFLVMCNSDLSIVSYAKTMDIALASALKREAINISSLDVCAEEMAKIDAIKLRQARRLAFTLLCLSKYWDVVNRNADHWVNSKDNEIMGLANINTSLRRQSSLYHSLCEDGLIQLSKKVDNTNVRVLFVSEGEPILRVTDVRNLGYQYLMFKGEPYFECSNCGVVTKYSNPTNKGNQKYCPECALKMKIEQNAMWALRRNQNKVLKK